MDNWEKILELHDRQSNKNCSRYIDATIISVREDYLRATVKFITGQVVENMLNKSKEKLSVGQNVKVEYFTTPSKGWIALAYGEARPLKEDKSSGNWRVYNAAMTTSDNIDDWDLEREFMYDYAPQIQLYYSGAPTFIVVQGILCYYGTLNDLPSGGGSVTPQTLRGSEETFQKIIDSKNLLSASSRGTLSAPNHSLTYFTVSSNVATPRYYNWDLMPNGSYFYRTANFPGFRQAWCLFQSQWQFPTARIAAGSPITDYFYDNLSELQKSYVTPYGTSGARSTIGGWAYETHTYSDGRKYGSQYMYSLATDAFVLPLVIGMSAGATYSNIYCPHGYARMYLIPMVNNRWCYDSLSTISSVGTINVPFASADEYTFAAALTVRSEPYLS